MSRSHTDYPALSAHLRRDGEGGQVIEFGEATSRGGGACRSCP